MIVSESVTCWVNPFTGLAGDMLLAALLDAGAPLEGVRAAIAKTGLTDWQLDAERVDEHGLAATRLRVRVTDDQESRPAGQLIEMAARVTPHPIARFAVSALSAIAEAEARLHATTVSEVHLHELGGHDALIDIVGVGAALHALAVDRVVSAPLPLSAGRIGSAHGLIPQPAPATLALLEGAAVVTTDLPGETVTPTAAALLKAAGARYGGPPAMTLGVTGYGAGTRQLRDRPNVAAVTLGHATSIDAQASLPSGSIEEPVVELATNLDDVTAEALAYTVAGALQAGAHDAWVTPAVMKKGRAAHVLHVLVDPDEADRLERLIFAETGSLGVRRSVLTRTTLPRAVDTVVLDGHPIRLKIGPHGAKPEFDDVAVAARRLGRPLRAVSQQALGLYAARHAQSARPGPEGDPQPDARAD
ncbi:MAG TPA: LarC family nickel insertion protein [Actinocrinis sp.]|nr:LarC family nickel insertion protein [Actinocrinis sp.]